MQTVISAIDKMRIVTNWFGWQDEGFAQRFKTVQQLEKVYDFAKENNFEFLDDYSEYDDEEVEQIEKFLKSLK